jgi:hypothetical protein
VDGLVYSALTSATREVPCSGEMNDFRVRQASKYPKSNTTIATPFRSLRRPQQVALRFELQEWEMATHDHVSVIPGES